MDKQQKTNKTFFLISFIPALAYWYLESRYPIHIAVTGGIILATLEIVFEKIYFKHIHTIAKFNFFLIAFLGSLSLLGSDGLWFKLQPMISGVVMGIIFYIKEDLMHEMMTTMNPKAVLPKEFMVSMQKHLGVFSLVYGVFMGYVALKLSSDQWIFFKTGGFYIATFIFFIFEFIYLRKKIKSLSSQN